MLIYDGRDDKKAPPTKHTAAVVSAGRILCGETDMLTIRQKGREDWSLFYCEAGRFYVDDRSLGPGELWIYPPGKPQKYMLYSQDKTVYRWLHFTGSDIGALLEALGIPVCTVLSVKGGVLSGLLENIQNSTKEHSALEELNGEYLTLLLLSRIAGSSARLREANMMKRITDHMEHSFTEDYDPEQYAGMLNISVSRFNHLFRQWVGMAPYAYYTRLRMSNACSLLEETDLKVCRIAEQCGYRDPLYFAQAFRKATGMSPTEYRKKR